MWRSFSGLHSGIEVTVCRQTVLLKKKQKPFVLSVFSLPLTLHHVSPLCPHLAWKALEKCTVSLWSYGFLMASSLVFVCVFANVSLTH